MTSGLTRRRLVRSGVAVAAAGPVAALAACGGGGSSTASTTPNGRKQHLQAHKRPATPEAALEQLMAGNERYIQGEGVHKVDESVRRVGLAEEQKPYAAILGCADSRVPPEVIFDQGLGDLFVVRVAGNVLDDHALGSIEYAAEHLGTRLVVVLGHQRCGAVKAAKETIASGSMPHDHIASLVEALRPAVLATKGEDVEDTCKANVHDVAQALRDSQPVLHGMAGSGQLKVVSAYYDLDTGVVTFLDG